MTPAKRDTALLGGYTGQLRAGTVLVSGDTVLQWLSWRCPVVHECQALLA